MAFRLDSCAVGYLTIHIEDSAPDDIGDDTLSSEEYYCGDDLKLTRKRYQLSFAHNFSALIEMKDLY